MNPEDRKLDALLDKALTEYGVADPRAGLENRVLANLRIEREQQSQVRRWWALGSAFAMVTVAGAIWIGFRHLPSTSSETTNVRVTERVGSPASSSHERISSVQAGTGKVHRRTAERRLPAKSGQTFQPKLSEFSSSRPLSEQERLVLAYVKVAPRSEVLAAVARAHDSSDLQIEDLEIAPLAND